jgi:hypothetical protein
VANSSITILFLLLGTAAGSYGQTQKTFKVKAGDYPDKVIPVSEQFQFPTFERGKILFYGGRTEEAPLNYTYLGGNVLFLNNKKDTLAFTDQKLVKVVDIQGAIFYNDKQHGFCEMVTAFGDVKLVKKHVLARIGNEKGGPYGISYTASSVTTYSSYSNEASPGGRKLKMDTEAIFGHRILFFFVDPNDRFLIPGKNSISRLFPKNKNELAQYLKTNPVNFTVQADLERLLSYCQSLQ